jgi:hypothetical protein
MDTLDRIWEICQLGEEDALSKIADVIGMTDVEKERDELARELKIWQEAVEGLSILDDAGYFYDRGECVKTRVETIKAQHQGEKA